MANFDFIKTIFMLTLISLSEAGCVEREAQGSLSSESNIYSESPCEMRPFSAMKDNKGNLWGIGEGNLWWFNATNLSWSLLPLPNNTMTFDPWKVTCGDPRRYIVLQGPSGTLILHLPWQHWQFVDNDDVRASTIDSTTSFCENGILYGTDASRNALYILDHEEARWSLHSDMLDTSDSNDTITGGKSVNWLLPDGQFILLEEQETCSHLLETNATGSAWNVIAKTKNGEAWPQLSDIVKTWSQGKQKLWLWEYTKKGEQLWVFFMDQLTWKKITSKNILSKLNNVITTWMKRDELCILSRGDTCTAQYMQSVVRCWKDIESSDGKETANGSSCNSTSTSTSTVISSSTSATTSAHVMTKAAHNKHMSRMQVIPPSSTDISATSTMKSKSSVAPIINKYFHLSALHAVAESNALSIRGDTPITAAIPSRNNPWHQHTSVFGSIIFFGTSLTVFGIVGSFWCIKRCVHFPKEALLLRDPPSVRYTAIPDSVPYDSRGRPANINYSVIPDAIA